MKLIIAIFTLTLALIITGCQQEKAVSTEDHVSHQATDTQKSEAPPKSSEDWIAESNAASLLKEEGVTEPIHYLVEDLDNDEIPEVIADYGSFAEGLRETHYGFTIFKQVEETKEWEIATEYQDDLLNEFHLYGVLETPAEEKIIVGSETIASATNMYSSMKLFGIDMENKSIHSLATHPISDEEEFTIKVEDNQLLLKVMDYDGNIVEDELFKWNSDNILRSNQRVVILQNFDHYFDQEFVDKLHQHQLKGIPYKLGTKIEDIKKELGNPDIEDYHAGAPIFGYHDLNVFFAHLMQKDTLISIIYTVPEQLSYDDLKALLGTPTFSGIDEVAGVYREVYQMEDSILSVESLDVERESGISIIQFSSKL
jgi:hypothetical protein